MLNALKKLTTSGTKNETEVVKPPGLQTMSRVLQNKFSKGVQYNMKIIIKGDRNVGKTCLFNRLQGRGFVETYTPTEEIQVASIQWNYKATDDIVKVEVWDVVDKGKKRVLSENLKLGIATTIHEEITPALDAEFLNVYKNTNGVVLVMDVTKNWTFEYVQRELEKIPKTIPVLVLGNHCDMSHHRCVTADHVLYFLEVLQRSSPARYSESSMYNGFGLKFLHKWFNLPFLQLQRETLLAQLERNAAEVNITAQELDLYQQTDDSNYKVYLERLTNHRRKVAEQNSFVPSSSIVIQTQHNFPPAVIKDLPEKPVLPELQSVSTESSTVCSEPKIVAHYDEIKTDSCKVKAEIPLASKLDLSLKNIEEFVPDDYLDKSFLEDSTHQVTVHKPSPGNDSDSDHEVDGNPLVSGFQDDLDPEDFFPANNLENQKSHVTSFTAVSNLETWIPESRGSPDGGDDVSKSADATVSSKPGSDKEQPSISDKSKNKKSSKKKKSKSKNDELENFFNSDYEAL